MNTSTLVQSQMNLIKTIYGSFRSVLKYLQKLIPLLFFYVHQFNSVDI